MRASLLRRLLLRLLRIPEVTRPLAPLMRGTATIFMLHRFDQPETGVTGTDPEVLASFLDYLRGEDYQILGLEELFDRLGGEGSPPRRSVAFTIDDGYREQATVAAPVFTHFDCPVTIFVTTGFLDGSLWLWWDQVEHLFLESPRESIELTLSDRRLEYRLGDEPHRRRCARDFSQRCKNVADAERRKAVNRLRAAADVRLPDSPPERYAPMSWDEVRACERRGISFAPHTVTHPVLSRVPEERCSNEIVESWNRLRAESRSPVPLFAYPNGRRRDFGPREIRVLRESSIRGALSAAPAYATVRAFQDEDGRYRVPRHGFPRDVSRAIKIASGLDRARYVLRPGAGRRPEAAASATLHSGSR